MAQALKVREEDVIEELKKTKQESDDFRIKSAPEEQIKKQICRKDLLEEHLLIFAFGDLKNLSLITEKDFSFL